MADNTGWGWANGVQINTGTAFNNDKTGQVEVATGQNGVGNPYSTAPTGNYADKSWTPQQQYQYSLLMSQGKNQEAAALGAQNWADYDKRRAQQNSVNASWQHDINAWNQNAQNQAGKYAYAVLNPKTGTYSAIDPSSGKWTDNLTWDQVKGNASDKLLQEKPEWQWQQEAQDAQKAQEYQSRYDNQVNQQRAMASQVRFKPGQSFGVD